MARLRGKRHVKQCTNRFRGNVCLTDSAGPQQSIELLIGRSPALRNLSN